MNRYDSDMEGGALEGSNAATAWATGEARKCGRRIVWTVSLEEPADLLGWETTAGMGGISVVWRRGRDYVSVRHRLHIPGSRRAISAIRSWSR